MAELEKKSISELPENTSPSTSAVLVGVDEGETVKIPITEFVTKDENGNVKIRNGAKVTFYNKDESDYCVLECEEDGTLSLNGNTVATLDDIPSGSGGSIGDNIDVSTISGVNYIEFDGQSGYIESDNGKLIIDGVNVAITGVNKIETVNEGTGTPGQVLTSNGSTVYWGNPNGGGTSSGSSNSIPCISFGCYSPEFTVADLMNELPSEVMISGQAAIVSFMGMLNGTFLCRFSEYHSGYYGCEFTDLTNLKTYRFEGYSSTLSLYDNLSGESSGEASMPRIRLSNWKYTEPARMTCFDPVEFEGEITFSVCIQDGTVQEGDELQICALRKTYGKYKLRRFADKVITAEDIENLAKQPFLQVSTQVKDIYRTDSAQPSQKKPKYIRIRRPVYGYNNSGEYVVVSALFSNVVPVHIGLKYEDITQYE